MTTRIRDAEHVLRLAALEAPGQPTVDALAEAAAAYKQAVFDELTDRVMSQILDLGVRP